MPVSSRAAAMIAAAALNVTTLHAAPAGGPEGVWLDHTGRGAVEIKPCGDKLCGHVVWVKSAADAKGCGRQIIGDAKAAGRAVHSGWIYSPERGKRYNVELTPMTDGRLKVLGYAGTKLFSKTMYWSPAAADLQRCDAVSKTAPQTAAAPAQKPAQATAAAVQSPTAAKAVQPPAASTPVAAPAAAKPAAVPAPQAATPPAPATAATAPSKPAAAPAPSAQTAATSQPETAEPPAQDTAQDSTQAPDASEEDAGPPRRLARILDQVLKRSADGDCKLDLPWVKVEFDCDQN